MGQTSKVAVFVAIFIEAKYLAGDWSNAVFYRGTCHIMLQRLAVCITLYGSRMTRAPSRALLAACVLCGAGCDNPFGPRTYEDCVLKNLQGAANNAVVARVEDACREKFPEKPAPQVKTRELQVHELAAVTGRASSGYSNVFRGTLYNGNTNVTVTEVQVEIDSKETGKDVSRPYAVNLMVPPLTAKDFTFDIIVGDKGSEYGWRVISARGY